MSAYYNEFKPEAAHMLRQLIRDGLIADGEVDERSITEVSSDDIKGFTQCHFFAGIGGWSVALRLAGWPDDRPVWTGSCPCQPFSTAGKRKGKADERHLWPVWFRLIRESRPAVVFGEQVASAIAHGWWDDVATDMEGEGYAVGAAVLPACSVGKPHKRDRLWFVGNAKHDGWNGRQVAGSDATPVRDNTQRKNCASKLTGAGEPSNVANTSHLISDERGRGNDNSAWRGNEGAAGTDSGLHWLLCPDGKQRPVISRIYSLAHGVSHDTFAEHEGCNGNVQKGKIDAAQNRGGEKMSDVQNGIGAQAVQREIGGLYCIPETEILFTELREYEADNNRQGVSPESEKVSQNSLRDLPRYGKAPCSPQRWKPKEQRPVEFADFMRFLSSQISLAKWTQEAEDCLPLQSLWESCQGEGIYDVRKALPEIQKVWQSLNNEERERKSRLLFNSRRFYWRMMPLLQVGVKHRTPILHAFGNAIVPQVAAAFIEATGNL